MGFCNNLNNYWSDYVQITAMILLFFSWFTVAKCYNPRTFAWLRSYILGRMSLTYDTRYFLSARSIAYSCLDSVISVCGNPFQIESRRMLISADNIQQTLPHILTSPSPPHILLTNSHPPWCWCVISASNDVRKTTYIWFLLSRGGSHPRYSSTDFASTCTG